MPSSAETSPSCMTPFPDSDGSSSCSASVRPARRWYCSAWRMTPAARMGSPSSVKAAAPASASSAISVSRSPAWPTVMAAVKPGGHPRLVRGRARAASAAPAPSPPPGPCSAWRGWRSSRRPPPRGCRCRCPPRPPGRGCAGERGGPRRPGTRAGRRRRPARRPSGAASEPGSPSAAITPSWTSRSANPSKPVRGSSRCAPRMSTVAGATSAQSRAISAGAALMRAGAPRARRPPGPRGPWPPGRAPPPAARTAPPSGRRPRTRPGW